MDQKHCALLSFLLLLAGTGCSTGESGSNTDSQGESSTSDSAPEGTTGEDGAAGDKVTVRVVTQHTRSDENRAGVYEAIEEYAQSVSDQYVFRA